ncbi:transglutaminase family protein [Hydrogenobaculum sp.]
MTKNLKVYSFLLILVYLSITFSIISISLVSFSPIFFIGVALVVIGIFQDFKNKYLPRIVVNTIAVLSVVVVFAVSFNITGLFDFAKNIIVTFLGIKSLEKKQPRDVYQILILETMGMGIVGVATTDIKFLAMLVIWVFLSIFIFLTTNIFKSLKDETLTKYHIKLISYAVGFISLSTVVIGFFIFLVMPRIQSPLLNVGIGGISNTVGFSNTLSPSNATNVLENTSTVFRIFNIKGDINLKDAYFIGETLDYFNGISWTHKHSAKGPKVLKGNVVSYDIMIEPSYDNTLFGILFPYMVNIYKSPTKAYITSDNTIKTDKPITNRTVYKVWSYTANSYRQNLVNINRFLQLPQNIDPSIVKLAKFLKAQNKNPIEAVENYFKQENFKYSLSNKASKDFLYDFLFKYKTGNCEAYASSTALLLRLMGVPSRVVVGFHGAIYNKDGHYFFVTNSLAHSWVEAYYNGEWQTVDTTPIDYTNTIPKLSKARMFFDYINYLWDINVVYYSSTRQKYLLESAVKNIKAVAIHYAKYLVYVVVVLTLMYIAFNKVLLIFSIDAMYKDICKRLKQADIKYCTPEHVSDFIRENGFKDFFDIYIKAKYSKYGIDKKEKKLAKIYYNNTVKAIKEFNSSIYRQIS